MMGSKFWNELAAKVKVASAAPAPHVANTPVPNQIPLHEARIAGFFKIAKPMGWGLYRAEDIDGGLGSIWSIEKDAATGNQFLVKQVDPAGEVLRKTASADRVATAPPGEEKVVKKLKEDQNVENPWAVAWSIHNKKKAAADPKKRDEVSKKMTGKPYGALPDDGTEQDAVMHETERYMEDARGRHPIPEGSDWGKKAEGLPGDEPEELSEMAQLIQEIAYDQVRAGIVEDQGDVEREVAAWFESSYGSAPDMNAIREEIKKNYPIGQEKALGGGQQKQAALDGCPKCGGQLTDMGGVYMCQACEDKNKAPAGDPGEPKKIAQLRKIVNEGQNAKVDGVRVDLFSASAVVQVYDAISETAKAKYVSMPVVKMVDIAFKLLNDQKKATQDGHQKKAEINGPQNLPGIAKRLVEIRKELEYGNSDDARDWLHALSTETPGALGRRIGRVWAAMEKDTENGIDEMVTLFREIGGDEHEWDQACDGEDHNADQQCPECAAIDPHMTEHGIGPKPKIGSIHIANEAVEMVCEKCGAQTGGTKLCLKCSPESTMFKKPDGASMYGPLDSSASRNRKAALEGGLDAMTESYLQTALWAETDNSTESGGEPLDSNYSISDIAPESLEKAKADCAAFEQKAGPLLEGLPREGKDVRDIVGHDFWLTRNGHGAGFWDGDYPEEIGDALTKLCKEFGECYIEVGDDGKIYLR